MTAVDADLVTVSSWGLHAPGQHLDGLPAGDPRLAHGAVVEPAALLGRKGLSRKEPSTVSAICAVHRALGLAQGERRPPGAPDPGTAVVAASNLGNAHTVAEIARMVAGGRAREVSVLQAPNASSNVLASGVSAWFGFGGPSLMICSGATAALDGLLVGARLLRSGRAERVVVVGVEVADETTRALLGCGPVPAADAAGADGASGVEFGAGCVVLTRAVPGQGSVGVALGATRLGWPGWPGGVRDDGAPRADPRRLSSGGTGLVEVIRAIGRVAAHGGCEALSRDRQGPGGRSVTLVAERRPGGSGTDRRALR